MSEVIAVNKEVVAWVPPVDWVKEKIEEAGTQIGSVHFNKRSGGFRKMSYRLHVQNPSVATKPKGLTEKVYICTICGKTKGVCSEGPFASETIIKVPKKNQKSRKDIDLKNNQMTVLDVNKVVRDKNGKKIGRGQWRTIPLENVVRICNNKTVYTINNKYK